MVKGRAALGDVDHVAGEQALALAVIVARLAKRTQKRQRGLVEPVLRDIDKQIAERQGVAGETLRIGRKQRC